MIVAVPSTASKKTRDLSLFFRIIRQHTHSLELLFFLRIIRQHSQRAPCTQTNSRPVFVLSDYPTTHTLSGAAVFLSDYPTTHTTGTMHANKLETSLCSFGLSDNTHTLWSCCFSFGLSDNTHNGHHARKQTRDLPLFFRIIRQHIHSLELLFFFRIIRQHM
jgi:hypothetical protein